MHILVKWTMLCYLFVLESVFDSLEVENPFLEVIGTMVMLLDGVSSFLLWITKGIALTANIKMK